MLEVEWKRKYYWRAEWDSEIVVVDSSDNRVTWIDRNGWTKDLKVSDETRNELLPLLALSMSDEEDISKRGSCLWLENNASAWYWHPGSQESILSRSWRGHCRSESPGNSFSHNNLSQRTLRLHTNLLLYIMASVLAGRVREHILIHVWPHGLHTDMSRQRPFHDLLYCLCASSLIYSCPAIEPPGHYPLFAPFTWSQKARVIT